MRPRADGLAPSDCAGQGAGYRGAAPQAADPSAHRQPGRSASPSAASWPAPAVAQPGATSIRPPAICCTSTSRSWDVSSALATGSRATDAIPLRGPAGTSSSWPSMTTPAGPSPTSPPTSASPAPSSSSRTQWPTTSAWAMRAWVSRLRRSSTIASALAGAIARGETVGPPGPEPGSGPAICAQSAHRRGPLQAHKLDGRSIAGPFRVDVGRSIGHAYGCSSGRAP
ncbi:hypothetical protein L561_2824 [Bordetella pertussis STO1-CHOC-0019]|nr:hypothetical protein L561_2824 [Bordetella pertussis STO1-CHOC-0019]